tara:strand:- start:5186 stop:5725 length:540 start_codon:yes stop_codon:yes gene_type:complete
MLGGVAAHLAPKHPRILLVRGFFMILMLDFNFVGFSYNLYSQQVMILQLGPILAALLAVIWLKESFSKHQLLVAIICLVGVWFIINPRFGSGSIYLLFAVGAAFFNAMANIFIARPRDKSSPIGFTFYGILLTALMSGSYDRLYTEQPSLMAILGAGLIMAAGISLPLRAGVKSLSTSK